MRNKLGVLIVAAIVILTIGYALVAGGEPTTQLTDTPAADSQDITPQSTPTTQQTSNESQPEQPRTVTAPGRYTEFTADRQSEQGFNNTILFFYASWCPECRGFDQAIQNSSIPEGTQILRVNFDQSQQLRQQYGVTIQTTFVRVTSDGEFVTKWVGYGQDKSVDTILQNIGN